MAKCNELTSIIYKIAKQLPVEEQFGLTSQITRCCVSIPSNIAEGCAKSSDKELSRFLKISLGSAFELETQILIIEKNILPQCTDTKAAINDTVIIQKQLISLIYKLKTPLH